MSKFFKWLKKDKQQQESPVVNDVPLEKADEHVNSELESIKNVNSTYDSSIVNPNEFEQSKQAATINDLESDTHIHKTLETDSLKIENSRSYIDVVSENSSEETKELVESEAETLVTETTVESTPSLENTSLVENEPTVEVLDQPSIEQQDAENSGFFSKLRRGLSRTKESIGSGIVSLFRGKAIDDELFEELETQLLMADVGMDTTVKIIRQLTESSDRKQLKDGDALYQLLKEQMADILKKVESPLTLKAESGPFVILMVGVNGVGKTTTIGKMAKQFQQQGKKVMLAAGDTFRAAAVEQLQVWGDRNNIPVVAQQTGSDSASVI